ncbi:MAG: class I SAM-dependent methyltransferase [Spirochaetaceae bacterium]|nr:MAG: class I SAM-dependent methyltransferase [Spirochaetaceae bacterium]
MKNRDDSIVQPDTTHWSKFAQMWSRIGPPLRPPGEDVALVKRLVTEWSRANGAPRGLIMGVTPEYYSFGWPDGSSIVAVDHSQSMIDEVWPGPKAAARCADWTDMPIADASVDIALCDGGLILLPHPEGHIRLAQELGRVVGRGGICIFRLFSPVPGDDDSDRVLGDLLSGKLESVNHMKVRLWTATQKTLTEGVRLGDVWTMIQQAVPDLDALAARLGWSTDHLNVLQVYKDSSTRYWCPTPADIHRMFCEERSLFEMQLVHTPTYAVGAHCPTIVLRRR